MPENAFITTVRASAARRCFTVAFPDAEDARVLKAALLLRDQKIASPVLVGAAAAIRKTAGDGGLDLAGIEIVDPAASPLAEEFAGLLFEKRKAKGLTLRAGGRPRAPAALLRRADARHGPRQGRRRRQRLVDRRRHPGRDPYRRRRPGHLDREQLLHHGAPRRAHALLRRLRGEPRPERGAAGRHRHQLGEELPGGDRPRAARGDAVVLDQGQRRPTRSSRRCRRPPPSCARRRPS